MQTIQDLIRRVKTGAQPVVTFKDGIGDKESYAEEGMRARLLSVEQERDGVVKIRFDFEEFEAHNRPLESRNYYDRSGVACLTAREAGYYKPQEDLYFDRDEQLYSLLTVEDAAAERVYAAYKAEESPLGYVAWLEQKLLAAGVL